MEYEIQSRTNLLQSDWQSEGFIIGSESTNWTPLSVAQMGRKNLFIRLKSWRSSDGSGMPDWWELQYFGTNGVDPYGDPAGDGWSNYQKFQNGWNPNVFYAPPTPQGLAAALHQSSGTATITWLPSPGAVTRYVLEKTDTYNATVQDFTNPATSTSFQDNLSADTQDPWNGLNYDVSYRVTAIYTNGNASAWTASVPLQQPTVSAHVIPGANGATYLAVSGIPANAASVRLVFIDEDARLLQNDASFDYTETIPVSSFTNGLYPLPATWQPTVDSYGNNNDYVFAESVDAEGNPSAATFFDGEAGPWPAGYDWNVPSYDGRVQMKQNLIFQLRAAAVDNALHFDISRGSGIFGAYGGEYRYTTNYAYAGLYEYADPSADNSYFSHNSFDPFLPYEENHLFRNFCFTPADADSRGDLITGLSISNIFPDAVILDAPAYQFQISMTNASALLTPTATRWLFYEPSYYGDGPDSFISYGGNTITMASGGLNWFGLPYVSVNVAGQSATSGGLLTNVITAGNSYTLLNYTNGYNLYPEVRQPQFKTVEYDFWNPSGWIGTSFTYATPLPGDPAFSTTNRSQSLIIPLNAQIQIAGYVKLEVTNSAYSGVYAYLGQYFDKAYKIGANGMATTNPTGLLSFYGSFSATEPGPVALVTMPDVDTGQRGTDVVNCVSLNVDKNHDGVMDLN
ncbi:MAG TPA: hypothetical protein VF607_01415, partial [Verrucomicrobiae bacterium]